MGVSKSQKSKAKFKKWDLTLSQGNKAVKTSSAYLQKRWGKAKFHMQFCCKNFACAKMINSCWGTVFSIYMIVLFLWQLKNYWYTQIIMKKDSLTGNIHLYKSLLSKYIYLT